MLRNLGAVKNLRMPGNLERLTELTEWAGWTTDSIINEMTIYPYYRTVSGNFYDSLLETAKTGAGSTPSKLATNLTGKIIRQKSIVFCQECRADAFNEHGFLYLKREHYLPGVYVCASHERPLTISMISDESTLSLQGLGDDVGGKLEGILDSEFALFLARKSKLLLNYDEEKSRKEARDNRLKIKRGIEELGWLSASGRLIDGRLFEAWSRECNQEFLGSLGVKCSRLQPWLKKVVEGGINNRFLVHPIWMLILEWLVLKETAQDPQFALFRYIKGDIMKCPNPICGREMSVVLGQMKQCDRCGYTFKVSKKRAVISEIIDRGERWRKHLSTLLQEEAPLKKIAAELGASPITIKREALKLGFKARWKTPPDVKEVGVSIARLRSEREKWLVVRQSNPLAGRKELRKLTPITWKWLYRNDRTWLYENYPENLLDLKKCSMDAVRKIEDRDKAKTLISMIRSGELRNTIGGKRPTFNKLSAVLNLPLLSNARYQPLYRWTSRVACLLIASSKALSSKKVYREGAND